MALNGPLLIFSVHGNWPGVTMAAHQWTGDISPWDGLTTGGHHTASQCKCRLLQYWCQTRYQISQTKDVNNLLDICMLQRGPSGLSLARKISVGFVAGFECTTWEC